MTNDRLPLPEVIHPDSGIERQTSVDVAGLVHIDGDPDLRFSRVFIQAQRADRVRSAPVALKDARDNSSKPVIVLKLSPATFPKHWPNKPLALSEQPDYLAEVSSSIFAFWNANQQESPLVLL